MHSPRRIFVIVEKSEIIKGHRQLSQDESVMGRTQSRGTCQFCAKELSKGGMTKHLASCAKRKEAIAQADAKKTGKIEPIFHLRVTDAYNKDYWLDLEMKGSSSLNTLDNYLRAIWLECCGHMSEFFTGGRFAQEVGKTRKLADVINRGELTHVYDFGTSSETLVTCVGSREGKPLSKHAIALMARNNQPVYDCIECGKPATRLCLECIYEENHDGWLCDKHAQGHPHDSYDEPLRVVNSPRMGMCGYDGPADPPY